MLMFTCTWKQKPWAIPDPHFGFSYLTFLFISMQNQLIFWWSYVQWHTNILSLSKSKKTLVLKNLVWLWKIKACFQKYMPQFQLKFAVTSRSLQTKNNMALQYTSMFWNFRNSRTHRKSTSTNTWESIICFLFFPPQRHASASKEDL